MNRAIPFFVLLCLACLASACSTVKPLSVVPDAPSTQPGATISVKELDELTYAYADSYVTRGELRGQVHILSPPSVALRFRLESSHRRTRGADHLRRNTA